MTRALWVLAFLPLAGLPFACTSSDGQAQGSGGGAAILADECNPVSGAGCLAAGSDCDVDFGSGFFVCYPPPNAVDVCGTCDLDSMTCAANLTCLIPDGAATGTCLRYCCTAADCGPGGTCDTALAASALPILAVDMVGVCVTSTTTAAPACSPPAVSPSGGTCVGDYTPSGDAGIPDSGGSDAGAADGGDAGADHADGGSSDGG